ncbi:hypothetical protein [Neomegalonema sp.]|uniref:hypothetical protein n=1 Tax=Neomegalonema sp. TaxID=2039713 RepID=UPI002637DD33|nr:hypothetical protein [Neomegalonema sp.]MDD2867591.1 hypothetical protein [Neomegalonema sp.]
MLQASPRERVAPQTPGTTPETTQIRAPTLTGGDVLCAMPARWIWNPQGAPDGGPGPGPRHRTLRRRGVAPLYAEPSELKGALKGRIEASDQGLRLFSDEGAAWLTLPGEQILVKVFHRNAVELHLASGARVLVGLAERDVEVLDVVTQAYL